MSDGWSVYRVLAPFRKENDGAGCPDEVLYRHLEARGVFSADRRFILLPGGSEGPHLMFVGWTAGSKSEGLKMLERFSRE